MKKIDWQNTPELFTGTVAPLIRMSKELLDFYSYSNVAYLRAECPSAVTMQFKTDTAKLKIAMTFGQFARNIYTTDIFVNNHLTTLDGEGPHELELGRGEKTVVIHFPHLLTLTALEVAVDNDCVVLPIAEKLPKLVLCGDSIMQGMTCSTPSRALGVITARNLGMELHNLSVGGAVMQPIPAAGAVKLNGAVTIVEFGANDTAQNIAPELFRERTRKVLEILKNSSGKAFIVTPIPTTAEWESRRELYSNIIREEQQHCPGVILIEGNDIFPKDDKLFIDGVHPNDQGMEIYAAALTAAIKKAL